MCGVFTPHPHTSVCLFAKYFLVAFICCLAALEGYLHGSPFEQGFSVPISNQIKYSLPDLFGLLVHLCVFSLLAPS